MTGISVSFVSGRSGAGNSTICANLGIAISQMDVKTVIVDADVEGASMNLIFGLSFDVPTIHDYLSGKVGVDEVTFNLKSTGVDLVVGSIEVKSLKDIKFELFKELIPVLKERYDVVLIDTPAGLSADTATSLSTSDVVVLVVTPDIISVTNALKTLIMTKDMDLKVLGVIANKTGDEYDIPVPYIEDMLGVDVLGSILEDATVKRSLSTGNIFLLTNPQSPAAKSIKQIATKLVGG